MKMICLLVYVVALAIAPANAAECARDSYGNVVCGRGQCAADQYGKVYCAREGGGAVRDQYGVVRCGIGFCAKDDGGEIKCSRTAGGGARIDSSGKVKCLAGCQDGSPRLCEEPR